MACWEHANQKFSSREEIGNAILLELFEIEPATKIVFGYQPNSRQDIKSHPVLRMGLMVHGQRIVQMIDQVLDVLGPDTDVLKEILADVGQRHQRKGVQKEHFVHMGSAIRGALSKILEPENYSAEVDMAWKDIFDKLSQTIVQSME
jgi:hemoglobin-like flavoprotein